MHLYNTEQVLLSVADDVTQVFFFLIYNMFIYFNIHSESRYILLHIILFNQ